MSEWTGVGGKRIVITGATSGIGLAAACALASRGADLAIVARSRERAEDAVERIAAAAAPGVARPEVLNADLSHLAEVRRLAAEIRQRYARLDVLINNAGAMYATRQLTRDGIERTFALNHLAPFALTVDLLDLLRASAPARIIITSSGAHYGAPAIPFDDLNADRGYPRMGYPRYAESKLANVLFTAELARRLQGTGVTANCFHPGFVGTGFGRNNGGLMGLALKLGHVFARRPRKGAETLVWLAEAPELSDVSGGYFFDKRQRRPSHAARDTDAAARLWAVSAQLVADRAAVDNGPR